MSHINRKLAVAVTGAVAIALVVAGSLYVVGGDSHDSTSAFCAEMPDSLGLYPGNPVTQMGYRVGRVDNVEPAGDRVIVSFSLDPGREYRADVQVVTRSKSLLADRSLELVGNYDSGPHLEPGECIPMNRSFTPKSISEIVGSAADFVDAMTPAEGDKSLAHAIGSLDTELQGQGENARAMLEHASAAAESPDQLVSDIGSSVLNMAPLTEEALHNWSTVSSLLNEVPDVVAEGIDLWPGVTKLVDGTGYLIAVLYSIQDHYGDLLWPTMHGPVSDAIHLAATRSKDLASLLDSLPSVTTVLQQQFGRPGGPTMNYQPMTVDTGSGEPVVLTGNLDRLLVEGVR